MADITTDIGTTFEPVSIETLVQQSAQRVERDTEQQA